MKHFFLALTLAVIVFVGTSCDSGGDGYPLKTCVVSGEPLDSMGGPVSIQHDGKTVKFCCKSCIDDFKKDPAPYLEKLTQASAPAK